MNITEKELKDKYLGCWFGKNLGGTMGAPYEWRRQINDIKGYIPEIKGNPLPNDDLDIQLLWLIAMEENGCKLDAQTLAHYWEVFVTPHWAEYGIAKANMKLGLIPPFTGAYNNAYKHSCGSYIRSEIWAAMAPGTPEQAVNLMVKDASIDHGGNTEGTYASIFVVAMDSAAYIIKDVKKLVEIGLSYIPRNCGVYKAVNMVKTMYEQGKTYIETRDELLRKFGGMPFVYYDNGKPVYLVSERDKELGLDKGVKGYDVVDNIGIVVIGLLYGENDIIKSVITAINCGEDTDCTAATIGSIFGIILGYEGLPKEWLEPIGDKIITCCLNKGEIERQIPADVYELTNRTFNMFKKFELSYPLNIKLGEKTDITEIDLNANPYYLKRLYKFIDCMEFDSTFLKAYVNYPNGFNYEIGEEVEVEIIIENKYKTSESVEISIEENQSYTIDKNNKIIFIPSSTYGDYIQSTKFKFTFNGITNSNLVMVKLRMIGRAVTDSFTIPFILKSDSNPVKF